MIHVKACIDVNLTELARDRMQMWVTMLHT